jgi:hypothetical protein
MRKERQAFSEKVEERRKLEEVRIRPFHLQLLTALSGIDSSNSLSLAGCVQELLAVTQAERRSNRVKAHELKSARQARSPMRELEHTHCGEEEFAEQLFNDVIVDRRCVFSTCVSARHENCWSILPCTISCVFSLCVATRIPRSSESVCWRSAGRCTSAEQVN